jgi:hypothetical protein
VIRGNLHGHPTTPIEPARPSEVCRTTIPSDQRKAIIASAADRRDRIALYLLLDYGIPQRRAHGGPLQALRPPAQAADDLHGGPEGPRRADPRSILLGWTSNVMRMFGEGIGPNDFEAVERWTASFNERPIVERDAVIGGATNRMLAQFQSPTAGPRAKTPARQARRKSERAARKRNRRPR